MKKCSRCQTEKGLDMFFRRARASDGLQPHCKVCQAEMQRVRLKSEAGKLARAEYQKANRERINEYQRGWAFDKYKKNPARFNEAAKATQRRACDELRFSYVKKLISKSAGCKVSDVPDGLAKAVKARLMVVRLIKEESK